MYKPKYTNPYYEWILLQQMVLPLGINNNYFFEYRIFHM